MKILKQIGSFAGVLLALVFMFSISISSCDNAGAGEENTIQEAEEDADEHPNGEGEEHPNGEEEDEHPNSDHPQ